MTLAPSDAAWLIKETSTDETVLIGGQAVAFWAAYFGLSPRIDVLTADIDYLGTRAAAKRIAGRLKVPLTLSVAGLDDATPNSAVLEVRLQGYPQPIVIDFLAGIVGLAPAAIRKAAVTVRIGEVPVRVIHPLHLLQSKLWNLHRLAEKRTPEGREQARLAIGIAGAYMDKALTGPRELLDAIETVAKFAATEPSRTARKSFGLECLDAVPARAFAKGVLPAEFREKRWPRILKTI